MATMAMPNIPFDVQMDELLEDVTFIRLGLNIANRMSLLGRLTYKTFTLIYAFKIAVKKQSELIDILNGPAIQELSGVHLATLAEKIERLVEMNDAVLAGSPTRFVPLSESFQALESQRDQLESIAESYRCAAEFECGNLLAVTLETVCA